MGPRPAKKLKNEKISLSILSDVVPVCDTSDAELPDDKNNKE